MKDPIRTYALLVCLISLVAGSVSLIVGAYDVIQISFPEATNAGYQMQLQQAAEQQRILGEQIAARAGGATLTQGTIANDLTAIQIPKPNHTYYVNAATQSLIISVLVFLVCAAVYIFHWRLAREHRPNDHPAA